MAQSQQAQAAGSNTEAMRLAMAASRKDANLERVALRKGHISQAVMSGDLGAKARNAIQHRKEMMALIDETRSYYDENLPYTFVYDPMLQEGKIDYEKETLTVSFKAAMILNSNVIDDAKMLQRALIANPEYEEWELGTNVAPYPVLFARVSIVNGEGEVIGQTKNEDRRHVQTRNLKLRDFQCMKAAAIMDIILLAE